MIKHKVFLRNHNDKVMAIFADIVNKDKLMMVNLETLQADYIDKRVAVTLDKIQNDIKKHWIKERFNKIGINPDFMLDIQVRNLVS